MNRLMPGAAISIALLLPLVAAASESEQDQQQRNECPGRQTVQVAADCIERGIYQPCDLGNRVGTADCGWAYAEVAERKIRRAEQKILKVLRDNHAGNDILEAFAKWQKGWLAFRNEHCALSDKLVEFQAEGMEGRVEGGTDLNRGFCVRRLTEARASELETLLQVLSPKAFGDQSRGG
jgi:uncharacterized protein YecT (DUF1311 family)